MQECFTIGISSRALFDLEVENAIFENQGVEAYVDYQIAHEKDVLAPGAAFAVCLRLPQSQTLFQYSFLRHFGILTVHLYSFLSLVLEE